MSMIFILIWIKFYIDINNDELLKNIWEHKERKQKVGCCWQYVAMWNPSIDMSVPSECLS